MGKFHLMKDPYYAQLMYAIERQAYKADIRAEQAGFRLSDSNIKSAYNKARKYLASGIPGAVAKLESREDYVIELAAAIAGLRAQSRMDDSDLDDGMATEASASDWITAIEVTEESLKLRKSPEPGTRFYLDFLRDFITQGTVSIPTDFSA